MTLRRADGSTFSTSYGHYLQEDPVGDSPKIYIPFRLSGDTSVFYALLDTGAAWTMLTHQLARKWQLVDLSGLPISISTRLGRIEGKLVRTSLSLCAESGSDIAVDATVFISEEWDGENAPVIIGYRGLLEHLRFAVDPGREVLRWHFGVAD